MKALLTLERYILSELLDEAWTAESDKKFKKLQKHVYSELYDKKMLTEHINFLTESLKECKPKLEKIKDKATFIDDTDNIKKLEPTTELNIIAEHVILKLMNKLSESDELKQKHFENKYAFKYTSLVNYFLPSSYESYLLESSKKKNKEDKIKEFKKNVVLVIS